jgi:hypothetical protein
MALTRLPKNAFATGSVDTSKIEDGTIQAVEISGTLPQDKIATGTIANAKLSNTSITINGTSVALGASVSVGVEVNWQSVITADGSTATTGVAGNGYFIDTTSNAHTFNLPASAALGDQIAIKDYAGTFNTNNLTIGRNGHNIQGVANNSLITTNRASLLLVYVDSTKGWLYAEESNVADLGLPPEYVAATGGTITTSGDFKIHTFTGDGCFVVSNGGLITPAGGSTQVDYLVLAGGGSGGYNIGGGGGAGGYRESHSTCVSGPYTASPLATPTGITVSATTYPITVGGGAAGSGTSPGPGNQGSNSVFSTITSAGGGGGGSRYLTGGNPINNGGSGGGGGVNDGCTPAIIGSIAGSGNTPPVSPPQGNNGGGSPSANPASGGGGAGAAGTTGTGSTSGPGGNGVTTSINASPVTRAGGGGGGAHTGIGQTVGTGGSGGGTDGIGPGTSSSSPANSGGGSGGGGQLGGQSGNGGSGVVIIRYKFQ